MASNVVTATNLDSRVIDTQLRIGVCVLGLAMAAAVLLLHASVSWQLRSVLFLPFFFGFYGLHAGLTGTCGVNALMGRRVTGEGIEPIASPEERACARQRGAYVLASIAATSLAATSMLVLAH